MLLYGSQCCVVTLCIILNVLGGHGKVVPRVGWTPHQWLRVWKRDETRRMDVDGTPGKTGSQACASSVLGQM